MNYELAIKLYALSANCLLFALAAHIYGTNSIGAERAWATAFEGWFRLAFLLTFTAATISLFV